MERKRKPAVMISAVKSGSGKTTFTCALLQALKDNGMRVKAFKSGPDYIDPMFHEKVIGIPSDNLDCFFSTEEHLKTVFYRDDSEISVVEGAMGLYDGLGGISEEGSAYHLASVLHIPIILVIDAHGMGRTIIPLLDGILRYDKKKLIKGVILNKTSLAFCDTVSPVIEQELGIKVLGCIPKLKNIHFESRHLGLKMPEEISGIKEQLRDIAKVLEQNVQLDQITRIARENVVEVCLSKTNSRLPSKVKIGVAKDEAFCFYYEENIRCLEEQGAEPVLFSPLHDQTLPEDIDGILLGGGYPELFASQLEENRTMRDSVKKAIEGGMPSIAECGGFMYLHDEMEDKAGRIYKMCGAWKGKCYDTGKLVRFGYIQLQEKRKKWLGENGIKAHEFHYYDSENNGDDCRAVKPVTEKQWECIYEEDRKFWGFPHLYYASDPEFVRMFIKKAEEYKKERQEREYGKE